MQINTDNLLTIANYAKSRNVTSSYIYMLIKRGKLTPTYIDNIQFIDKTKPFKNGK